MAFYLDAACIIILVMTCVIGYSRGFVRYVICMLGTLVSVIAALAASSYLAQPVYERYLRSPVTAAVESALERIDVNSIIREQLEENGLSGFLTDDDIERAVSAGGDAAENIGEMLSDKGADAELAKQTQDELSQYFDNDLTAAITEQYEQSGLNEQFSSMEITSQQIQRCAELICSGDKPQAAQYIVDNAAAPALISMVEGALFVGCFVLAEFMIRLILWISGVFNRLPPLNAANRFGGLALGAVKGMLYIALIAYLLCVLVNVTHNCLDTFNVSVSDSTYIFKYFFNFFFK